MFKKWRGRKLISRLTGLRRRQTALCDMLNDSEKKPYIYIDEHLDMAQQIAELEFKIECLKDDL